MAMISIIGGPQSSGTSLLRQILNRHSEVMCLNESHLFCKREFYNNWQKARMKINSRGAFGIKSEGWKIFSGIDYNNNPGLDRTEIGNLARTSTTFQSFTDAVFRLLATPSTTYFMDKTPANVFSFSAFLETFEDSKVIACIRNPYDIAASLVSRRINVLDAVCLIKSAFISIIKLLEDSRMYLIKYEDLVREPEDIVREVCNHMGLVFHTDMIEASSEESSVITQLEGWNYDEASAIGKGSVGRFLQIHEELQEKIKYAMLHVSWKNQDSIFLELCERLQYSLHDAPMLAPFKKELKKLKTRSLIEKISYLHPYGIMNNPVSII